jgi:hypothetical protein
VQKAWAAFLTSVATLTGDAEKLFGHHYEPP